MPRNYLTDDTIAAIATAIQPAYRAVVRLSGPEAHRVAQAVVTVSHWPSKFPTAVRGQLRHAPVPVSADVWLWQEPASYTGESMAELHIPGAPPLARWTLEQSLLAGARMAEPGEFTLRAFLHGKVDLTEAEAVLAVTRATDDATLRTALSQLDGGLLNPLTRVRSLLVDVLVELEAGLDFAEEDIEFITPERLMDALGQAYQLLETIQHQMAERQEAPSEPVVVLTGEPNAGKSSLFNAMSRGDLAIVTPLAGTTRDYLTARVDLGNAATLRLVDTPGVEPRSEDTPDGKAQLLARMLREQAALELFCLPCDRAWPEPAPESLPAETPQVWLVLTKADLLSDDALEQLQQRVRRLRPRQPVVAVSVCDRPGIDALLERLGRWARGPMAQAAASVVPETAARCRRSISAALDELKRARSAVEQGMPEDLIASSVRSALYEIGLVTGEVHVEEILDGIFQRFCIGK